MGLHVLFQVLFFRFVQALKGVVREHTHPHNPNPDSRAKEETNTVTVSIRTAGTDETMTLAADPGKTTVLDIFEAIAAEKNHDTQFMLQTMNLYAYGKKAEAYRRLIEYTGKLTSVEMVLTPKLIAGGIRRGDASDGRSDNPRGCLTCCDSRFGSPDANALTIDFSLKLVPFEAEVIP